MLPGGEIPKPPLPGLVLRAARADDEPFIRERIFATAWETLPAADRRAGRTAIRDSLQTTTALLRAREGSQLLVAERCEAEDAAAERVGLLWLGLQFNPVTGEAEAWIYELSVIQPMRRQGIGAWLLQHARRLAQLAGHDRMVLMVAAGNEAAQRLYRSAGYQPTHTLMRLDLNRG